MTSKIYGIDFGTTNSAVAVAENGDVRVLPILEKERKTMRSVLFFPRNERGYFVGEEAISQYVETGMEGRFMQSVKTFLADRGFTGTVIRGKNYTIENLIALILRELKVRADRIVGEDVRSVILGRPARFSEDAEFDELAERRLVEAAKQAGFQEVCLQLEPIAAAYSYELTLGKSELVFIADLGGGTSDFAVIRLDPQKRRRQDRFSDIMGTLGAYVGGDNLDSEIMSHKLLRFFGSQIHYQSFDKVLPMPAHLMRALCEWHRISSLKDTQYREFVKMLRRSADDKKAIEYLHALIEEDLGFSLFRIIERSKQHLSTDMSDKIRFHESVIHIEEDITREEFEWMISKEVYSIERCVDQLITRSGVAVSDIDSVFLTGGISHIPRLRKIFTDKFGKKTLRSGDVFVSVAEGLALSASALSWSS